MGVTLVAKHLTVEIPRAGPDGQPKVLLDDVNLSASPGEMLAIMGPSGSGKTTLLNVLANRKDRAFNVSGEVTFNARADELDKISTFSAYVMQDDHFLEFLTVLETLTFAARLRLGRRSKREQQERIAFALEELGLQGCQHVLVGGPDVKGISGGQKKRLSIACAVLARPQVLFLDEPTSSLDASMAYDVVKTMENMAHAHRPTVVCTIHQPRSQVFALFDSLLLLRLGKTVYRGDPTHAVTWFSSIGHPCPAEFNPPDFFLDLLTEASGLETKAKAAAEAASATLQPELDPKPEPTAHLKANTSMAPDKKGSVVRVAISSEAADQLAIAFDGSDMNARQLREMDELAKVSGEIERCDATHFNGVYWFVRAVAILALRDIKNKIRNPASLFASVGQALFMSIVLGTIFFKQGWPQMDRPLEDPDNCDSQVLRNMAGAMAQFIAVLAFAAFDCAVDVIKERPLINREASGGLYSRSARYISSMAAGTVFSYWAPIIVCLIMYWMVGLHANAGDWFTTLVLALSLSFAAVSLAKMCGYLAGSIPVAIALLPLFGVNMFLVSGFQISDDAVPGWLVWLKNISYFRFALQGLMRLQFHGNDYLDRCMGFQTPHSAWLNIIYCFLSGVGCRIIGFVAQLFMHTRAGLTV